MRQNGSFRTRAIILGLILIPINCYWIAQLEVVRYTHLTLIVPFPNVIFILLIITSINIAFKKFSSWFSLNQRELLLIYVMLSIASALSSIDMLQILVPSMGHVFWFATPENEWEEILWRYLPRWLLVSEHSVLTGYYKGGSSFYNSKVIKAWLSPLLYWFMLIMVLLFVMLCINVLIRKQWTERERLTFPIIQLPLEMTELSNRFFRDKLMWLGFGISAFISIINGLNYFIPSIPQIPVKRRSISYIFTERPWNAMGNVQLSFYPFVIGISFMIPLDLLFSAWVFYWLFKAQQIAGSIVGFNSLPQFPYYNEQAFGGFVGICIIMFWSSKTHFLSMIRNIYNKKAQSDDSSEPLPYRTAVAGIVLGGLFLYFFSFKAGMSAWSIPMFFGLYYLLAIFITRLRAELGFLVHNFSYLKPSNNLVTILGTRRLGPETLTMFSIYNFFIRTCRCHPMPHQFEGFKIAERTQIESKKLLIPIMLSAVFGSIIMLWILLHEYYKFGADTGHFEIWTLGLGNEVYRQLQNWLYYPTEPDYTSVGFMFGGFIVTIFLAFMRTRFLWWSLHPLGYVMANDWGMFNLWSCILVSYVVKSLILKNGGLKAYRKSVPFFLGLAIGDYSIGCLWSIIGVLMDTTIYQFFP
ncbi:MAG: DUF6785 family protein [bacterium]